MKFCFWGNIADALMGTTIGGGELQMALLARSLASEGHEVVVIDPYIEKPFISPEGVRVINVSNWNKGWPVVRMFTYRIPSIYRLMLSQKADFYYVRMRSILNLVSYKAARKVKAKFLIGLASDIDLMSFRDKYRYQYKNNFNLSRYLTEWLPSDIITRYLIKKADYVIRQHEGQVLKKQTIKGKVILFPNIVETANLPQNEVNNEKGGYYIYLGSLTIVKGADLLYDLINKLHETEVITIVGQPNDIKAVSIFDQLKKLKNTDLKGRKSHMESMEYLSNAKALINTSRFEGFPNVFLEAWALGIPVLSLKVDPGNIIDKYSLGKCFNGDLNKMRDFMNTEKQHEISGERLKSYIMHYHDFNTAGKRFFSLLT